MAWGILTSISSSYEEAWERKHGPGNCMLCFKSTQLQLHWANSQLKGQPTRGSVEKEVSETHMSLIRQCSAVWCSYVNIENHSRATSAWKKYGETQVHHFIGFKVKLVHMYLINFFGYDCPAVQSSCGNMQPSELANLKVVCALVLQLLSHFCFIFLFKDITCC